MSIRKRAKKLDELLFDFFKCQWNQHHLFSEVSNLNIKELFTIQILGLKNNSATMSELANVFSIPATTMTSIVDKLVNKEYLKRFRSKKDRRIVKVTLSPNGREIYEKQYELLLESKITVLETLSKKEQQDLILLMEKALIILKKQVK